MFSLYIDEIDIRDGGPVQKMYTVRPTGSHNAREVKGGFSTWDAAWKWKRDNIDAPSVKPCRQFKPSVLKRLA